MLSDDEQIHGTSVEMEYDTELSIYFQRERNKKKNYNFQLHLIGNRAKWKICAPHPPHIYSIFIPKNFVIIISLLLLL